MFLVLVVICFCVLFLFILIVIIVVILRLMNSGFFVICFYIIEVLCYVIDVVFDKIGILIWGSFKLIWVVVLVYDDFEMLIRLVVVLEFVFEYFIVKVFYGLEE